MMEVAEEATYIKKSKVRLMLLFSAMRHFREALERDGTPVVYTELEDPDNGGSFAAELKRQIGLLEPESLVLTRPGDFRVDAIIRDTAKRLGIRLRIVEDDHFLSTPDEFMRFAEDRKSLVLEHFYRQMRRRHDVLMDGDKPAGGKWNFDSENRKPLPAKEARAAPKLGTKKRDAIDRAVAEMIERRFADHPGSIERFAYPVTRDQALADLDRFIDERLEHFGSYQDAMVEGHHFLYHSRLSAALNLHLINPREVIDAAVDAYARGAAPLNAVEGFVRQVLGWREFIRGIYWQQGLEYLDANALGADEPVPAALWTGETDMRCVADSMRGVLEHGYAHHIQRLMVLGLLCLLLGVRPRDVHEWHMALYADAVDWVSAPNVIGMSQYGDGGIVGTKPYAASGSYINRMSNYCKGCRFDPKRATGENACPFTTLYWDFLDRHRERFAKNRRMALQVKNVERKQDEEIRSIRERAQELRLELP